MNLPFIPSLRYSAWSPIRARLVLISLLLVIGYGLVNDGPELKDETPSHKIITKEDHTDLAFYLTLVERIQSGEDFYVANGDEQHKRGYPTKPFLTWRLPTSAWVISTLGEATAANLLRLLVVFAMLAWIYGLKEAGLSRFGVVTGVILLYTSLMIMLVIPVLYLHEAWAATLIALSLPLRTCCWRLSVILGLTALAFRELALLFVVVMAMSAWMEGFRREATWWFIGMILFFIMLTWHAWMVNMHIPADARFGQGWLALGGWFFVLSANQWNILSNTIGAWVACIWLPMALIGAAAVPSGLGNRLTLTVMGYTLAFLFVGRQDNGYWGIIYSPLVAVSIIFVPQALRSLWEAASLKPR